MKRKLSFLLVLLFLSAWLPACTSVRAASPPELGMGYDAASIVPVSQAVPVNPPRDQICEQSKNHNTNTNELLPPANNHTNYKMMQIVL